MVTWTLKWIHSLTLTVKSWLLFLPLKLTGKAMLEQSGKIKAKMPLFHPILFSYYGTFDIKDLLSFLLQNSYIWSHLQLRSWFCRQRIFTSSHSSWFYFQTIAWNYLFLSIQEIPPPQCNWPLSQGDCYISEWPPRVPSCPIHPFSLEQPETEVSHCHLPPQWLCTALRIT